MQKYNKKHKLKKEVKWVGYWESGKDAGDKAAIRIRIRNTFFRWPIRVDTMQTPQHDNKSHTTTQNKCYNTTQHNNKNNNMTTEVITQ